MKKTIAFVLTLCIALALVGCGNADIPMDNTSGNSGGTRRVEPLATTIDVGAVTDGELAVSFDAASLHTEGDAVTLDVKVYDFVQYDAAEVAQLKVGDTIVVDGRDVTVTAIDDSNGYIINGGYEQGGLSLAVLDGGVMYVYGPDDTKEYYEVGSVTLPVNDACSLTDSSDPANVQNVALNDLAAFLTEDTVTFQPNNTTVTVSGGQITGITRVYTP